jgi:hypothetical protein
MLAMTDTAATTSPPPARTGDATENAPRMSSSTGRAMPVARISPSRRRREASSVSVFGKYFFGPATRTLAKVSGGACSKLAMWPPTMRTPSICFVISATSARARKAASSAFDVATVAIRRRFMGVSHPGPFAASSQRRRPSRAPQSAGRPRPREQGRPSSRTPSTSTRGRAVDQIVGSAGTTYSRVAFSRVVSEKPSRARSRPVRA